MTPHAPKRNVSGLLVCLTLLALAACGAPPTGTPTPPLPFATNRPTRTPSPTPAPSETPLPGGVVFTFPDAACCQGAPLQSGPYEAPLWLGVPMTMQVGSGWQAVNDQAVKVFFLGRGANALGHPSQRLFFINATGHGSPAAIIDALRPAPELVSLAEPSEAFLAGLVGVLWEASAKPNPTYAGNTGSGIPPQAQFLPILQPFFTPRLTFTTASPEARLRLLALTDETQTLLLYLEAPPAEWEAFVEEADTVLQSLKLIEP